MRSGFLAFFLIWIFYPQTSIGGHISPPVKLGFSCDEIVFMDSLVLDETIPIKAEWNSFEAPIFDHGASQEPVRYKIINAFNQFHAAVKSGNKEKQRQLLLMVPILFEEYQSSEVFQVDNPYMIMNSLLAGWFYALGHYEKAYKYDLHALKFEGGFNPGALNQEEIQRRRAIHFANLSSNLRKMAATVLILDNEKREKALSDALRFGKNAHILDPLNSAILIELALVLDDMGDSDGANHFLNMLLDHVRFNDPADGIADRIRQERDLLRRTHLDAVVVFLRELSK